MSTLASQRYTERIVASPLVLVQEILNTRSAGKPVQPDLLSSPESANAWLAAALAEWGRLSGLPVPEIVMNEAGLVRLQHLRDNLELHLGGHQPAAPSGWNAPEMRGSMAVTMDEAGVVRITPKGKDVSWVISAALYEMARADQMDLRRRLKLCKNEKCSVAFYDSTNNNNSVWHDVHICGNAANLRASRRRHAAVSA